MKITIDGTIAPYIWNGHSFVQSPLVDPGIFAPAGTSLTGDAFHITWDSNPATAQLTINDVTVTFGPTAVDSTISQHYQNITVCNCFYNVSINTYDLISNPTAPLGLGGGFEMCLPFGCSNGAAPLAGYFYVTNPPHAPGPIVGEGIGPLLVVVFVAAVISLRRPIGRHC